MRSVTACRICILVCAKAAGESAANDCAAAMARSITSAGSTASLTQPRCAATSAAKVAPLKIVSLKKYGGVACRMISKASAGNGTPTSISVTPMRPPSFAMMRRSAQQASTQPPAMAWPLIAAPNSERTDPSMSVTASR